MIKLNFEIIGNKEAADLYSTQDITLAGKIEREFYQLIDTDGWITVPVSKVGTISKIIADVVDPSSVLSTANLRIVYSGVPGDITIPINGIFVYSVDEDFADLITSVDISTNSTTAQNCSISIFGV